MILRQIVMVFRQPRPTGQQLRLSGKFQTDFHLFDFINNCRPYIFRHVAKNTCNFQQAYLLMC